MEKSCTKTELLKTAMDLMWAQSYGGVSVDDICRRSKAKKGSFYHFFESKAALGAAALEMLWEQLRPELDQIFSPQHAPLERLRAYTVSAHELQVDLKKRLGYVVGCPFSSIGSEQCSCDDGVTKKANEVFERVLKYLHSTVKDGIEEGSIPPIDPKVAATRLLIYELGALGLSRVSNTLKPLDGLYEAWLALLRIEAGEKR